MSEAPDSNERLASLDEWGGRKTIIPASVRGYFRKRRTVVYAVLLFIFMAMPWLKINGLQSILLDVPARRFIIFGQVFLAHDAPLIFLFALFLVLGLAFVTAVWGRAWCGWACPQTVFIDFVYRRIETWIEGDYIAQRKLAAAELSFEKITKRLIKWILFLVISSLIAHSFIAYFSGAERLIEMMKGSPEQNWGYFLLVTFFTLLFAFDFGWFREQFCIIMCPYGRFQSVLMDEKSVTVFYDEKRGEPRKGAPPLDVPRGDCVSCLRCVQVCPTAIDIRKGSQLECIACTACIDACDEIMDKLKKPRGLIRYSSQLGTGVNFKRPRVLAYLFIMVICVIGLNIGFFNRKPFSVSLIRAVDTPYQVLSDEVLNHYKLHLHNQSQQDQTFIVELSPEWKDKGVKVTMAERQHLVKSGQDRQVHFFVLFPGHLLNSGRAQFAISIEEVNSHSRQLVPLVVLGPKNN